MTTQPVTPSPAEAPFGEAYCLSHGIPVEIAEAHGWKLSGTSVTVPLSNKTWTSRTEGGWTCPRGQRPGIAAYGDVATASLVVACESPAKALAVHHHLGYATIAGVGIYGLTCKKDRGWHVLRDEVLDALDGGAQGRRLVIMFDRDFVDGHGLVRRAAGLLAQAFVDAGGTVAIAEHIEGGCTSCRDVNHVLARHATGAQTIKGWVDDARGVHALTWRGPRGGLHHAKVGGVHPDVYRDRAFELRRGRLYDRWGRANALVAVEDDVLDAIGEPARYKGRRQLLCCSSASRWRCSNGHEAAYPNRCRVPGCPTCAALSLQVSRSKLDRLAAVMPGVLLISVIVTRADRTRALTRADVWPLLKWADENEEALEQAGVKGKIVEPVHFGALHEPEATWVAIIAIDADDPKLRESVIAALAPRAQGGKLRVSAAEPIAIGRDRAMRTLARVKGSISPQMAASDAAEVVVGAHGAPRGAGKINGLFHGNSLNRLEKEKALGSVPVVPTPADVAIDDGKVPEPCTPRRCLCGALLAEVDPEVPIADLKNEGWGLGRFRARGVWMPRGQFVLYLASEVAAAGGALAGPGSAPVQSGGLATGPPAAGAPGGPSADVGGLCGAFTAACSASSDGGATATVPAACDPWVAAGRSCSSTQG